MVYFRRILSPVGRNMQHFSCLPLCMLLAYYCTFGTNKDNNNNNNCASMFGVEVNNVDIINRKTAWFLHSGLSDYD